MPARLDGHPGPHRDAELRPPRVEPWRMVRVRYRPPVLPRPRGHDATWSREPASTPGEWLLRRTLLEVIQSPWGPEGRALSPAPRHLPELTDRHGLSVRGGR